MPERLVRPLEVKFAPESEQPGVFEGYGAVFGNVDAYGDVIKAGAFKATLKEWKAAKKLPPMLLQHGGWWGADELVPVGVWDEMREDETGLCVKGHLIALDTDRGKAVYAAMKEGALDGLSIGYLAREFSIGTKPEEPRRTLKSVELVEVSIVTFPANGEARVDAVKSGADMSEREFERFLRDAGFSRNQAKTLIAKGYRALRREAEDEAEVLQAIVAGLKTGAAILKESAHGSERSQGRR